MDELDLDPQAAQTNKEIWVHNFSEASAQKFREQLLSRAEEDPRRPILVYIDSYGGAVDGLAVMIETMEMVPNPIITICMGKAMSAGAILLSHGDMRYCSKHSRVMIHEVLGGTGGNVHDMHADAAETMRVNQHFIGLLANNCGIKNGYEGIRTIFKQHNSREIYMDAEAAKAFGLVDEVGVPVVASIAIHQVVTLPPKPSIDMAAFDLEDDSDEPEVATEAQSKNIKGKINKDKPTKSLKKTRKS